LGREWTFWDILSPKSVRVHLNGDGTRPVAGKSSPTQERDGTKLRLVAVFQGYPKYKPVQNLINRKSEICHHTNLT
jgi:hypothetical protein